MAVTLGFPQMWVKHILLIQPGLVGKYENSSELWAWEQGSLLGEVSDKCIPSFDLFFTETPE